MYFGSVWRLCFFKGRCIIEIIKKGEKTSYERAYGGESGTGSRD